MKPWIKRTLIGLFGASIVVGGLSACGQRHHGYGHGAAMSEEDASKFKARMVERVGKELELNEQQKQRLALVGERMREQRQALIGSTTDPRAEMQALVAGAQFDRARAQALIEEKTNAIRGKSPELLTALAEFYDSLNPAQQQKVRDFMQRRRGWFGHG
jgi:periplasmic protein CpxP/Spy